MTADGAAGTGVTTRCLIVDDQAIVREGFAAVLAAQPGLLVVGQAADGADAVRQARQLRPDVVLMDVRMPVMDGLQATRQILRAAADPDRPRVLMLTTFDLDDYVYEALRAGASGFLLKDATVAELVQAVRVVAAGDALLAPSVTRRLIADFARQPRPDPSFPRPLSGLTHRETEVLRLIARGLSNAEISDTLALPSRRPRPTSAASWPSSTSVTAPRPWCWPTRPVSSLRADRARSSHRDGDGRRSWRLIAGRPASPGPGKERPAAHRSPSCRCWCSRMRPACPARSSCSGSCAWPCA